MFVKLVAVNFEPAIFILVFAQQLFYVGHFLHVVFQFLAVTLILLFHDAFVLTLKQLQSSPQQLVFLGLLQQFLLPSDQLALQSVYFLPQLALTA